MLLPHANFCRAQRRTKIGRSRSLFDWHFLGGSMARRQSIPVHPRGRLVRLIPALVIALLPLTLFGQSPVQREATTSSWADDIIKQEGYAVPPKDLADAVLAPRHLNVALSNLSPDKKWFVDEIGDGPVTMKTFAKPFHELGGVFVDYKANRSRLMTIRNNVGVQLISAADGSKKAIQLPPGARVSGATWSPDSSGVAFFIHGEDATQIWFADVATGTGRPLTKLPVLATLVTTFEFSDDGKTIAFVQVPENRTPMPLPQPLPTGPTVKIADSDKNRLRTFPSLMSTVYEKELLEWHTTGQVALLDVQKAVVRKVGRAAMVRAVDISPDAKYVRVIRMVKPFSYDVPVTSFGSIEEVWDADGKVLAKVTERPINLGVQDDSQPLDPAARAGGGRGGEQQGKREVAWRRDGQGLTYLEQEPAPAGGRGPDAARGAAADDDQDPPTRGGRGQQPQRKDRLYQWTAPFDETSRTVIYENATRMTGVRYSTDMQVIFFSERTGQNAVETAVYLNDTTKKYTLARYRADDVYANPGTLVSTRGSAGGGGRGAGGAAAAAGGRGGGGGTGPVQLSADGQSVFFQGTTYDRNPNQIGPKSFIDRIAIKTGEKARIYESDNSNLFERVTSVLDADRSRFIVSREAPTEVPQNYLVEATRRVQLTKNQDYMPDITRAHVERLTVERPDGFTFRVTVNLPQDYQAGTRLPAIFWFYPREYQDQESYDRPDRTFNKNAFPTFGPRSMEYLVRLGYAVVEPDSPIVGTEGHMNDNYVHDLRSNLSAVIDELDRRALVDRTRLAIGGHSYGAFSAVNAMVHTPFFKAGIAGDGAYNRTLTPIGFQSERRDLWEAPNVYLNMSPFLYANHLTGALLMYHGLADQNVGTDPTNSLRLYHALNGLGKTTALYLYPLEDHGPASKETLLDLWARWAAWLDKYVKNPKPTQQEQRKITTSSENR
jgi:dipeptidyl aminopeptidase/acylaminoacyl peptidase